jgi:hypothetical protein
MWYTVFKMRKEAETLENKERQMKIRMTSVAPDGSTEDLGMAKSVERFEAKFASGYYVTNEDKYGREVEVTLTETEDGELVHEYPNGYSITGEIVS